jgi:hypothetical protein
MKNVVKSVTALCICLSVYCSGQVPAVTSADLSTSPPQAKVVPAAGDSKVNSNFCKQDIHSEVVGFCPALTALRDGVLAKKSRAELRGTLNQLNPASRTAMKHMVATIRIRQIPQMLKSDITSALQSAGQMRPDQQLGASNSASGTTSLVTKAGSAELLSLALDTGALTRSVNGSTATLSTNTDQLFRLLTGYNPDCLINCGKNGGAVGGFEADVLNRLNIAGSFSLAQSSTSTTATSGQASGTMPAAVAMIAIPTGAGRLTAVTAKYEILNKYDPRNAAFLAGWKNQISTLTPTAIAVEDDTQAVFVLLQKDDTFKAQEFSDNDATLLAAAADPTGKNLVAAFEVLWKSSHAEEALSDTDLPTAAAKLMQDRQLYRNAWATAIANAAGVMLSFQYTFNKPLNQPQTHDITVVYGYSWGQYGSMTFNGAASIYNGTLPLGANYGRVHYGQASGEYDRNLSNPNSSIQTQLSLAGYWQYQPNPSVLNIPTGTVAPGTTIPIPNGTQEFVGTAGSLWVTQGKLTIKGPGGINIPLGVSWSNKTDLLQGSKVGGQVGISYNFSSLAGLF